MDKNPIEIYETLDGKTRFYFSHSDKGLTTGVLVMEPGAALPKHNRPCAVENLVQIEGKCLMTLFDKNEESKDIGLAVNEGVRMKEGQWHIHANPYESTSVTLFKLEGDILDIMATLRKQNKRIESNTEKNLT